MINLIRPNLMRPNLGTAQKEIVEYRAHMPATVNAIVLNGQNVWEIVSVFASFQARSLPASGVLTGGEYSAATHSALMGAVFYGFRPSFSHDIQANVRAGLDSHVLLGLDAIVSAKAYSGRNSGQQFDMADGFQSAGTLSMNFHSGSISAIALWLCSIDTRLFSYIYVTIDADIPPGGVLVIDSNTYNVLLNGANVIHTHSGGWLDRLDRKTYDVMFRPLSGTMNADIQYLYDERWL